MFKLPQDDKHYSWTWHVIEKMKYYGISPGMVKRVIRKPTRTEEGIAPRTIAAMSPYGRSPAGRQTYRGEVWVMYRLMKKESSKQKNIKIITAWRYPGKSPKRNPIPEEILREVKSLL